MLNKFKRSMLMACGGMLMAMALTGCNASKDVLYMQNLTPEAVIAQVSAEPITIQPGDEIMVYVSCSDPEVAARLSLMSGSRRPEINNVGVSATNSSVMLPYTVNKAGDITMPEIGKVHVAGLTREQISHEVESRIIDAHLVKNNSVTVTVQFANLTYSAIGEIKNNGSYSITKDDMTILEALAIAGDLTIYGKRDAVWVIREEADGSRKAYKLNLKDTEFMQSPAYYVQQNDVIYVEPNGVRAGQSTLNENTFKSVGFWTSLASLAITIATFAITLSR
ncbi:MAG: polysaccharide biosynthesis/export family protein [Bacteroides sp.]|nr:polysaccharide biosynthesis/export family protein [Bacteroides sp.]MCM1379325.1 polysaccharide biosynthesis/export family protein [Bacteroides sp.]MCM1445016.1 polysaccharide biosynthesis/export family protein [Prevotella sp.]